MTPQERDSLRHSLLRFLSCNRTEFAVPQTLLLAMAKQESRPTLTIHELGDELVYLEDKGLVKRDPKLLSPELKSWRIMAAGRDYLAERGIE